MNGMNETMNISTLTDEWMKEINKSMKENKPEKSPQSLSASQRNEFGIQRPLLHWYSSSLEKKMF